MENEPMPSLFGLSIDHQSSATLRAASRWGKFLSVLGFILGVSILIFGFIIYNKITHPFRGGYTPTYSQSMENIALRYLVICTLLAGVLMTSAIFTLNFSNRVATGLEASDQFALNSGLSAIKNGIILWSIVFIIFILLMLLAFIGIYYL